MVSAEYFDGFTAVDFVIFEFFKQRNNYWCISLLLILMVP